MSHKNVLVIYKSVTGFTKEYAQWIAQEVNGTLMELKDAASDTMSGFETVIFGGRLHAGRVDGLKEAKDHFEQSGASRFVVYATGATPNEAKDVIDDMWKSNLTPAELQSIPHFYMQSGLRYEKMPFGDKMIMKMFCFMMKKKKEKSETERQTENTITGSFDSSSKEFIKPLIAALAPGEWEKP